MTFPPQRPQRRSCLPLPPLRESLPSPLPTPSSSPVYSCQNSLQLDLPVNGNGAERKPGSPNRRQFSEILALPRDSSQNGMGLELFHWPDIYRDEGDRDRSRQRGSPRVHSNQALASEPPHVCVTSFISRDLVLNTPFLSFMHF